MCLDHQLVRISGWGRGSTIGTRTGDMADGDYVPAYLNAPLQPLLSGSAARACTRCVALGLPWISGETLEASTVTQGAIRGHHAHPQAGPQRRLVQYQLQVLGGAVRNPMPTRTESGAGDCADAVGSPAFGARGVEPHPVVAVGASGCTWSSVSTPALSGFCAWAMVSSREDVEHSDIDVRRCRTVEVREPGWGGERGHARGADPVAQPRMPSGVVHGVCPRRRDLQMRVRLCVPVIEHRVDEDLRC